MCQVWGFWAPPPHPMVWSGSLGRGYLIEINDFSKDSLLQSHSAPEQLWREGSSLQLIICWKNTYPGVRPQSEYWWNILIFACLFVRFIMSTKTWKFKDLNHLFLFSHFCLAQDAAHLDHWNRTTHPKPTHPHPQGGGGGTLTIARGEGGGATRPWHIYIYIYISICTYL